jgi:muramoyltetrapeptide carboxypeptidase
MIKPRRLHAGDRIAVVAPASPFDRAEFDAGIRELRALGFEPVYGEEVFARRGYVSGDARLRAEAIRAAWTDPGVAALIAVRGGYGSVQTLPLLSMREATVTRKAFVGYSDLTAILIALLKAGLVCFHGPMLAGRLAKGPEGFDRDTFVRALSEARPLGELHAARLVTLNAGEAAGPLMGGTLTQLVASLGTPFAFDPPQGHVLFIEDVAERPYRLDRMLTQLRLAGILGRAIAIVVGELPRCDEPGGEPTGIAAVADVLRDFRGPIVAGFPSGHTTGPAMTLPLGVSARVVASANPRLVIEEAAVE